MTSCDLADGLWAEVNQAIHNACWQEAEGLLWRFLQLGPETPCVVWDSLGYVLLMQGDYVTCEQVLRPWTNAVDRTFWLNHKLGDALRGQNRLKEAAAYYRQSIQEGSSSPLTYRNLLQVLYGLDPVQATAELDTWLKTSPDPLSPPWHGAQAAATLVSGLEVAEWLWAHGLSDGPVRQRMLEACCYRLDIVQILKILEHCNERTSWEQQLQATLHQLGLRDG